MAAELRLNVALDLAFFKQQLPKLTQAAAGYSLPINVRINRQGLQQEVNYLSGYFRRKNYRIEVATNLGAEIKKAKDLIEELSKVDRALRAPTIAATRGSLPLGRLAGVKGKDTQIGASELKKFYKGITDAGLLEFKKDAAKSKASIVKELEQIGEDAFIGFLNGLESQNEKIKAAAQSVGKEILQTVKTELGMASPSKKFMEIGKDAILGFEIGLTGGLQSAKVRAVRGMQDLTLALKTEAVRGIRDLALAMRMEAAKLGQIDIGVGVGRGAQFRGGAGGILPPVGMGRLDLNARQGLTGIPRVASATGATGRMSMLPSSAIETYQMAGRQLALPSAEMRAAEAAAKVQKKASDAGRELSRSLREAAASIKTRFGARVPGSGIRFNQRQLAGYTAPIGPLPLGSAEPWAKSFGAGYMGGGFEPYMQSRVQSLRSILQGQKPLEAPAIGNRNVAESIASAQQQLKATQPIANRLREAAIEFSKNAPIVAQYLNSFRARKINISDLPGAGESPGQYIRRIQEAMRQGPFGAGTTISGGGGGFRFGQGSQVPGFPLQRALPPAGATTAAGRPGYPFDRVTGGMGGSGGGGRGGAIVPYAPRTELPAGYFTGGKIQQALKGADQYLKQSRVPLTGAIQELGSEFGNAVKQVLLFGTAYKALAFIINLPNQALAAATSLQTFNNQLLAVTGSAGAANQAFSFVDGLAERFNVPLESARQGFVRLYASMEPAGFAPDQIEGLFTGISKAAATFGLSADQVDRVTYAFSQMASKGQAMSEELKGQLGDVLPGSLALFARAAQMSIPEFTKALEDGAFKGEAFQALLRNVAKLMNTEFAGGAAGAADTLQGRMNDLSNSVTKMYESFEPLVGLISAQVFPQLSEIIGDATEAIQAFVAGIEGSDGPASKLNDRSRQIYEGLEQVKTVVDAVVNVFKALAPTLLSISKGLLAVVANIAKMLNTGVGKWLANFALQAAAVNAALLLMAKAGILRAAAAMIGLITNTKRAIFDLKILIKTSVAARFAIISLGGAVVLSALGALMAKIEQVNNKMLQLASSARNAEGAIRSMSQTEAIAEGRKYGRNLSLLKKMEARGGPGGVGMAQASAEEINALAEAGLTPGVSFTAPFDEKSRKYGGGFYDPAMVQSAIQRTQQLKGEARARVESINRPSTPMQLEGIDLSAGGSGGAGSTKAAKTAKEIRDISADRYILEQKLREAQEEENAIKILNLETALKVLDAEENTEGILDRRNKIEQAMADRRKEFKKIIEDERKEEERLAEERLRQANEIAQAQQEYNSLLIDAQEAAGAISPEAAEQRRREIQQQQTISRLTPFLTPDQLSSLRNAFDAIPVVGSLDEAMASLKRSFEEMASPVNQLITGAQGIGDAFANSFNAVITGSMTAKEALADFFGNVGKMFADMATRMLSQWLVMKAVGLVGSLFGGGSPASPAGAPGMPFDTSLNLGEDAGTTRLIGVPLTPYANGGIVKGPTMGLIGEGRFNEAVVPLPNGKSIPVDLGKNAAGNVSTNIVVNVNNGQTSSRVSGSQGNQLAKNLEGAVKEVIMRETRPGGIIYSSR